MTVNIKKILVMAPREDDLPGHLIPTGLKRVKETGTCEFCKNRVVYNRINMQQQKDKGYTPVLICIPCYEQGEHIRGGFTGT